MKRIAEGLLILLKYCPDGDCSAQHDIIYAAPSGFKETISNDDRDSLEKLGWFWDEDNRCWAHFT